MNEYIMDSNAPPQSRGKPCGFARGKSVVAKRQPDVDLTVIPNRFCYTERFKTWGSVADRQISFPVMGSREDRINQMNVRGRRLFIFHDGSSMSFRAIPGWHKYDNPSGKCELEKGKLSLWKAILF